MAEKKNVLLVRTEIKELSQKKLSEIWDKFLGCELTFITTEPKTDQEHLEDCERYDPALTVLPKGMPFPSTAMEHGYRHAAFQPDGSLQQVVSINAVS